MTAPKPNTELEAGGLFFSDDLEELRDEITEIFGPRPERAS